MNLDRCLKTLCFATLFAEASFAVNYAGPGGDMADPANWTGATLPGTTDAVTFGPTAVPSSGLTLSAPVTFGASTIDAGFANLLPVNLSGYSYKGAALSVKSDATFQNGFFTNTTLSVAANKTLTLSGAAGQCELKLTSDNTPFGEGSVLHVTEGATFRPGGTQFRPIASSTTMLIDKRATLDCLSMGANYNLAFFIRGVANVTLVVDNATAKFFTLNVGSAESGNTKSMVRNSLFSFRNGSTVTFSSLGGQSSRGFHLGYQGGYATSNRVEFVDSSIKNAQGLYVDGIYNTVLISNSTVNFKINTHANGRCNSLLLHGNSTFSGSVSLGGSTNLYVQTGGTASGATTVGGTTNRLEMSGGTRTGAVTVSGRNDEFRLSGGLFKAALTMSGVSNVYEHVSGVSTGNVTVAGFGNTLYFRGGTHWGQYRQALVFNANTTNNMVVIDDAEFIHHGTFGKSYSDGVGWPYVNTPNCAIEFRGAAPKFRVTSPNQANNSTPWHTVNLGKGREPLQDPVRLRFILPKAPYAEAPFRSEFSSRYYAVLDGNAVIEVDDSNLPRSHGRLRYPLVYDMGTFGNGTRIDVDSLNKVNHELGTIGEDMKFVRSGGTLYVEIASKAATKFYVR
jgi:hypothetical protein